MSRARHLTTRRGFIAAAGFGGVSLYALWAAYGAAPGPLSLLRLGADAQGAAGAAAVGHGGHGGGAAGPETEAFRRAVAEFIARYRMPDGSVYPRAGVMPAATAGQGGHAMPMTAAQGHAGGHGDHAAPVPAPDSHAGHGAAAPARQDAGQGGAHGGGHSGGHGALPAPAATAADHGGHGAPAAPAATADGHAGHGAEEPVEVFMLAERWAYEPAHLRLDVGVSYRFRMMASDVSHGASIQLGSGSRMTRLRPGTITEIEASFPRPGSYLVYCTVYCGTEHDRMQARIDVV